MLSIVNIHALLPEGMLDNAFIEIDNGIINAIGQANHYSLITIHSLLPKAF